MLLLQINTVNIKVISTLNNTTINATDKIIKYNRETLNN